MDPSTAEGGGGGESRGPVLLAVSVSTTSFALLMCGVRVVVRLRISRTIGWDDYAIYLAMIMGLVGMVLTILEGVADSVNDSIRAKMFDYLAAPWLMFGSTLSKISICFFFLRTIAKSRPWNLLLGLMIVVLAVVNLVLAMVANLQCRPLEKLWNPAVEGECFDPSVEMNIGFFQGGFAVFTFFFLALFPIMMIRDMDILRSIRWPFYVLAGLSLTAGIMSIVRTYETSLIGREVEYGANTFTATLLAIFIQNLGIVAANVLALGPLFNERARQLSHIEDADANELIIRHIGAGDNSARSSVVSAKDSSTTLIIEGPRKMGYTPEPHSPTRERRDLESGRRTANEENPRSHRRGISVQLRNMVTGHSGENGGGSGRGTPDPFANPDIPSEGILKTVEVEVVEEDITDLDRRRSLGERSNPDEDWQNVLRGVTVPMRANSRASARDRDSRLY